MYKNDYEKNVRGIKNKLLKVYAPIQLKKHFELADALIKHDEKNICKELGDCYGTRCFFMHRLAVKQMTLT